MQTKFIIFLSLFLIFFSMSICYSIDVEERYFEIKDILNDDFNEWFGDLHDDTRVRYLVTTPWDVPKEDVEYIIFLTAGQQGIKYSTNSNVTGHSGGIQEDYFNTDSNTYKELLSTVINKDNFDWLSDGMPTWKRIGFSVGLAYGEATIISKLFGLSSVANPVLSRVIKLAITFGEGLKIYNKLDYKINPEKIEGYYFFKPESAGGDIYYYRDKKMLDGTYFHQGNTLIIHNLRGLCVNDNEDDRKATEDAYIDWLSELSNDFKKVRMIYLAGHSRGGVQVLRLGEKLRTELNTKNKFTRIVISAIDAVVDPGEVYTSSSNTVRNPLDLGPDHMLKNDKHNYYAYFSDLNNYLHVSPKITNNVHYHHDGNMYINNLVSGSLLNDEVGDLGLGEMGEIIAANLTDTDDKRAVCMDYDKDQVQELERFGTFGVYSQRWVKRIHADLCTDYDIADIESQMMFFKNIGFFPSYNLRLEIGVEKNQPTHPIITWDPVPSDQVKKYRLYRKIIASYENELEEPQSVKDWDYIAETDGLIYIDTLPDNISNESKIYYKLTCWVENNDKYAFETPSSPMSEAYIWNVTTANDQYFYGKIHPFAQKYISVIDKMGLFPRKLDEAKYNQLPNNLKEFYEIRPDEDDDTYFIKESLSFEDKKELRTYCEDNNLFEGYEEMIDIFGNKSKHILNDDFDYKYSRFPGSYHKDDETGKITLNTLHSVVFNNEVKVVPIKILNFVKDMDFEFSINGSNYMAPHYYDDDLNEFEEYAYDFLSQSQIDDELVYADNGDAYVIGQFKEGYNVILIRVNDSYQYTCEIKVKIHTTPSFLDPQYPDTNQYVNIKNISNASLGIAQINEYMLDGWFDRADIKIVLANDTANPLSTTKVSDGTGDHVLFDLNNLQDGNHYLEAIVNVDSIENYTAWQFWVDTIAPEISFPQKNIISGIKRGMIAVQTTDTLPFRDLNGVTLTDVDTVFLRDLEMSIIYEKNGIPKKETIYRDINKPMLGLATLRWDGELNNGDILEHGTYQLEVKATDRSFNQKTVVGEVYIDKRGPEINAGFSHLIINKEISESDIGPSIHYTLNLDEWENNAHVELVMERLDSGELFYRTIGLKAAGVHEYILTEFTDKEDFKDGIYRITISAEDLSGYRRDFILPSLIVKRRTPFVQNCYVDPLFVHVDEVNQFYVNFSIGASNESSWLNNDVNVTITLNDKSGNEIRELYSGVHAEGEHISKAFSFPGTDNDGKYFINIKLEDFFGNEGSHESPVIKNKLLPEITQVRPLVTEGDTPVICGKDKITIWGKIPDPDFSNGASFLNYSLYYQPYTQGNEPPIPPDLNQLDGWLTNIQVPSYQQQNGLPSNFGSFSSENESYLGWLDGSVLSEGYLMFLLITGDDAGVKAAAVQPIYVTFSEGEEKPVNIHYNGYLPEQKDFSLNQDPVEFNYSVKHDGDNPVKINTYIKEKTTGNIVKKYEMSESYYYDLEGIPQIAQKGFYLYKNSQGRHYLVIKNDQVQQDTFGFYLETTLPMENLTVEGPIDPTEILSEDKQSLAAMVVLNINEFCRIGFDLSASSEILLKGGNEEDALPIFIGADDRSETDGMVIINNMLDSQSLYWDGKISIELGNTITQTWVNDGEYSFIVEAVGKKGGYDQEIVDIDIITPLSAKVLNVSNRIIKPNVSGEDSCTVTVSSRNARTLIIEVMDELNQVIQTLSPTPPELFGPGTFTFTWDGKNVADELVQNGEYWFNIKVIPAGSGPAQVLLVGKEDEPIEVNHDIVEDSTIPATLTSPIDGEIIKGDSSYIIEAEASGKYLPDQNINVTFVPGYGTQMVEAYPYLNYMAGLRLNYQELKARVRLSYIRYEIDVEGQPPCEREYYFTENSLDIPEADQVVVRHYFSDNNLGYTDFDQDVETLTFIFEEEIENVELKEYRIEVIYGQSYMNEDEATLENISYGISTHGFCIYGTIHCPVKKEAEFSLTDYYAIADFFWVKGPDVSPSSWGEKTDFVYYGNTQSYNFEIEKPAPLQTEAAWRDSETVRFYYIGENYPDPLEIGRPDYDNMNLDHSFTSRNSDGENTNLDTDGLAVDHGTNLSYQYTSVYSSLIEEESGNVKFTIQRQSSLLYEFTVTSTAKDYLTFKYPYGSLLPEHGHYVDGFMTAWINKERTQYVENLLPCFKVNRTKPDSSINVFIKGDTIPSRIISTDLVYRFDPPLISEYQGNLNLSTLFAKYPGPYENLNITSFRINSVSVPVNSTIKSIFGLINRRIHLGTTQLAIPGKDIKILLDETETAWSTKEDDYINSIAGSSGKMVSNSRDLDSIGALLHQTGKLDNEYYSTVYNEHDGNPALINEKSLFTIDSGDVVQDNPDVIVHNHPSINGMYDTRLLGIDKKPYGPVRVDKNSVYYTGKGSKNADSFEPGLTENPGKRLFPIAAQWDTTSQVELQLSYKDKNGTWITILAPDDPIADAENNILTYWDVSGLNGQYTLKLQAIIDNRIKLVTRNIYIGEAVDTSTPATIQSAKGEAELAIPAGSLNNNELISIDAVDAADIEDTVILPTIPTQGNIIDLQPDGLEFDEPVTLTFTYHTSELKFTNISEMKIYDLKSDGSLEEIPTIKAFYKTDGTQYFGNPELRNEWEYLKMWGTTSHFSYYCVLDQINYNYIQPDDYYLTTNADTITLTGIGLENKELVCMIEEHPYSDLSYLTAIPDVDASTDEQGNYEITDLPLKYEGSNFIFLSYKDDTENKFSKIVVYRDTTLPIITVNSYEIHISPETDSKKDIIYLPVMINEDASVKVSLKQMNQENLLLAEAEMKGDMLHTFEFNGKTENNNVFADGVYSFIIEAIDQYGNINTKDDISVIIDTEKPGVTIHSKKIVFTPVRKDNTIEYGEITFSVAETADVKVWIETEDEFQSIKLIEATSVNADEHITVEWNGRDITNRYVEPGKYNWFIECIDQAGNKSLITESVYVMSEITGDDDQAPVTTIQFGTPSYKSATNQLYITSQTLITLSAFDQPGGSGVAFLNYRLNGGTWNTTTNDFYTFTLNNGDGPYTIEYGSIDHAGNQESIQEFHVIIDNTPPETTITIYDPQYLSADNKLFITSKTPIELTARDNTGGSGIARFYYRLNNQLWVAINGDTYSFTLPEENGMQVFEYYCIDNLGNAESIKTIIVYLDNMPPETSVTVGDPKHLTSDDKLFITSHTPIELNAVDNSGGSGVAFITYRINDGTWMNINGADFTFTIPGEDAEYIVSYYSTDNCDNAESIKNITVYLDNTPPETSVTIGDPKYLAPDDKLFITSHTPIELHAVDNPGGSGVAFITYRINDGTWMNINGADFTFTIPGEDAEYIVSYYSTDNCDNAENMKSITVYLDNTPPVVKLCVELIGTSRRVYLPDDETDIELTDNEKLVAEVADATEKEIGSIILPILCSGLKSAKFRIANGVWQDLTLDNLDAALIGEDEVLTEIEAIDNVENTTLKSYIISHYAIFSVPGAVISVSEDISFLNSGIIIDSYNSETGMQHTNNGDVISKGRVIVNGDPDIRGDIYEYTETMIERVPVPADAQVINEIIVNSGQTKTIEHGTYYIKNLIVNSNARLVIQGGWVKIWFDNCTIDGKVEVDIVKHLWMLGTDATQYMNINGTTNFKGILFTHHAYINVNGNVDGSVIGKGVTVNSNANIYYDEDTQIHDRWITIDDDSQPEPDLPQTGQILRQWWSWIGGTTVSDLTNNVRYPDNPTGSAYITSFEGPSYWGDNYGSRIVGYLHPQSTGSYTFWIASDDQSELWLSTDTNPSNRVLIASVNEWTNPQEFDKFGSQQSVSIWLEADTMYYIEAIHKEGSLGDHLSVAWKIPEGTRQVIGGEYLSPLE